MEWYRFYLQWFTTGATTTWSYMGYFATSVTAIWYFLRYKYPKLRGNKSMRKIELLYPLIVLGIFLLIGLIIAPYSMYRTQQQNFLEQYNQLDTTVTDITTNFNNSKTEMHNQITLLEQQVEILDKQVAILRLNNPPMLDDLKASQWSKYRYNIIGYRKTIP